MCRVTHTWIAMKRFVSSVAEKDEEELNFNVWFSLSEAQSVEQQTYQEACFILLFCSS